MLTPLHLEILLHHHMSPLPFRASNEVIRSYRQYWIDEGCLESTDGGNSIHHTTDKGKAWLDHALNTPMPTQKWVWE